MAIRILIADDHEMVREGLKQLIELDKEFQVVQLAGDGQECLEKLGKNDIDVLLLDINMPKMNGLEVIQKMKSLSLNIPTIILTVHTEVEYLIKAVEYGIAGYMLKESNLDELKTAIVSVYNGETYIQPSMVPVLEKALPQKESDLALLSELTKREIEILKAVTIGKPNKEIAAQFDISERTVKNHVSSIFKKIDVLDRTQAAVFAIRNGLVDVYENCKDHNI